MGVIALPASWWADALKLMFAAALVSIVAALAILDLFAARAEARPLWICRRCGRTWVADAPPSSVLDRAGQIARTTVVPWRLAAFLLAPRHRLAPPDRIVSGLSRVRVVLGFCIVVGVSIWYRSYDRLELDQFIESWTVTGLLAIPSCLICIVLVVALTRASLRRVQLRQMRWPALSLLAFVAAMTLLAAFGLFADDITVALRNRDVRIPLDFVVYGGVFGLWIVVFSLRSAYLVTQNWFNAVDGHLLLPPVIAIWMAGVVAVKALIFERGASTLPSGVSLVLILGGAAATVAIALVESWRVARRYGVTLRDGPWPRPGKREEHDAAVATTR